MLASLLATFTGASGPDLVLVNLHANASTPFPHYWKRSFGSGHAKLTLRKDWRDHLVRAVTDLGLTGVRHHGLLDDDMAAVPAPGVYDSRRSMPPGTFSWRTA